MLASVSNEEDHILSLVLNKYSSPLILLLILNLSNSQLHSNNYKFNLPDPLDNKALLIATEDFTIDNIAAHLLSPENIMNAMITIAFSTGDYAVRLIAADYMRKQNIATPNDLLQQCGAVALTHSLPDALLNHGVISIIPGYTAYAVTGFYVLAKTSLDTIHCINDYRLSTLATGVANAAGDYVTDCIDDITYTLVHAREEHFDPLSNFINESYNFALNSFADITGICKFFAWNNE